MRGKDRLIIENRTKNQSINIPVSSIANMEGYGLSDSLAEEDFTLTYDPKCGSKYAPTVFTISSGQLYPKNFVELNITGEQLNTDGTTESNAVPWRGHNTNFWGSQGCITGQTGNSEGDYSDVVEQLNEWGITEKFDIQCSFINF